MINSHLISNFNNSTLTYDLKKFPFPELVKEIVKELFPQVEDLDELHTTVASEDLVKITNHVQKSFGSEEFGKLYDDFAEEYIKPLIGGSSYLIKRFPTLNLVVPNQIKLGRLLNFHKGTFYANGLGQGTIWMPLTDTFDSNSMWVVNHKDSNRISEEYVSKQASQKEFETECLKVARPVTLKPGQAHLFHQEQLHGNINNETGKTRLAIDWHILIKGEPFHQRYPGGFFRLPGDYHFTKPDLKKCVIYASNNTFVDKHLPSYIQTDMIENFCKKHDIKYGMRLLENEEAVHLPILEDIILQGHDIVMYSIHSLPEIVNRRNYLLDLALQHGIKLYFINEYILLNEDSLPKIKEYLSWRV